MSGLAKLSPLISKAPKITKFFLFSLYHKAQQSVQNGGDTPAWVPGAWMEIAHAQTESCVGLEPPVGCNHPDRWWFERVV